MDLLNGSTPRRNISPQSFDRITMDTQDIIITLQSLCTNIELLNKLFILWLQRSFNLPLLCQSKLLKYMYVVLYFLKHVLGIQLQDQLYS